MIWLRTSSVAPYRERARRNRGERINIVQMPESDLEIHWMALFDCPIRHLALMGRASAFADLHYDESLPIR
ncbi:MAG: hypothetical protein ACXWFY_08360 [Chthoniobacterales bacterium]